MKTKLTTALALLATCAFASAEPPEGGEKRKGPRGPRPVPQEVLEKFDADKDGKLNQEERRAAMEARRAEMLAKFDKDGDGELNQEERQAAREARRAEFIAKHDKDGDGELSKEERKAAREAMRRDRPGPRGNRGEDGPRARGDRPAPRGKRGPKPAAE